MQIKLTAHVAIHCGKSQELLTLYLKSHHNHPLPSNKHTIILQFCFSSISDLLGSL